MFQIYTIACTFLQTSCFCYCGQEPLSDSDYTHYMPLELCGVMFLHCGNTTPLVFIPLWQIWHFVWLQCWRSKKLSLGAVCYSQTGCSFDGNFANFHQNIGIFVESLSRESCNPREQVAITFVSFSKTVRKAVCGLRWLTYIINVPRRLRKGRK